ncbi:MAG TPA: hypothetical protein PKD37_03145 [Oligoflexia bacterium]|nr:hypothetical protein [Oligoflexia bacterium]HMP26964.1 hypothetical protein [Oligoflexia bacterium]
MKSCINILGIGHAFPENLISNELFFDLASSAGNSKESEIFQEERISAEAARRTVLDIDYLRNTGNRDTWQSVHNMSDTPTNLAERAARMALERANLKPEDIGLVIGDCITPLETTPSEGQRLAGRLGLKVPSFDLSTPFGALALQLEALNMISPAKLPDYVLLVSANTPTTRVNYSRGQADALYLGDAAAAVVCSYNQRAGIKLKEIACWQIEREEFFCAPLYGEIDFKYDVFKKVTNNLSSFILKEDSSADLVILPELFSLKLRPLIKAQTITTFEKVGYSLGAAEFIPLSLSWQDLSSMREIEVNVFSGDRLLKLKLEGKVV